MGQAAEKQESTALARDNSAAISGTFHTARAIDDRLSFAQANYHLVSPFQAAGALPEGCGVQLTLVRVDIQNETYDVGMGKVGLSKSALDRISHGVGISWDPMASRRLDDGRDPHYAHYRAVGRYRASDGQQQIVIGEKEMDLRDGSPQCEALEERARRKNKSAEAQIREMRMHILGHAETKARLRAIRSMGVRTSYTRDELEKPFAVARVVFTGKTADPELRREFSKMTAASFLGGVTTLYGEQPGHQRTLPAGHAAPPVGSVGDDDDFGADDAIDTTGEASCSATPANAPPTRNNTPPARPAASSGVRTIRFGNSQGTPITEADDNTLAWYRKAMAENVKNPQKARWRDENQADLDAVDAELRRRNGEVSDDGSDDSWPEEQ